MVSSASAYGNPENPSNPNAQEGNEDGQRKKISEYEQSREERIRENLERMQKLGIFDLSLKVKAHKPTPKTRKIHSTRSTPPNSSPLSPPGPIRRSSRLQSVTPISYSEALFPKKEKPLIIDADLLREEGSKPEFYTEDHEKLLGSTGLEWTLFVDGVGKDGKRIYDPVRGKTCHQCRQKTLGLRTHCSKCNMVQGQFCGDCLYMRYGENVIEANQNLNWICPVCRGICNCSLCRQAKGWPPTGMLYRKITSLGYKSVAHFLIQTRRLKPETEAASNSKVPVSAKRSLPFTHIAETSTEMPLMDCDINPLVSISPEYEAENLENFPCDKQEEKTHFLDGGECDFKEEEKMSFSDNEQGKVDTAMMKPVLDLNAEHPLHLGPRGKETDILVDKQYDCNDVTGEENGSLNKADLSISSLDKKGTFQIGKINSEFNGTKQDKASYIGNSEIDYTIAPEISTMSNKKRFRTIENTGDRDNKDHRPKGAENGTLVINQDSNDTLPQQSAEVDANNPNSSGKATVHDTIAKRLRKGCDEIKEQETNKFSSSAKAETETAIGVSTPVAAITSAKSKKKPIHSSEPSPDSIAGRLRQRRVQAGRCV